MDGLPRPSIRLLDSRELPKIPLEDDASLGEVKTWCTLQFASDQLSRVHAYNAAQASFDDAWSQQQSAVDKTFKLIAVLFEELVQELEDGRPKFWQQAVQTDTLSHEAIEDLFLKNATRAIDDAMRTVRAAMESYSFGVLSTIRRENYYGWSDTLQLSASASDSASDSDMPTQLGMAFKAPAPDTVFVSVYTCKMTLCPSLLLCREFSRCSHYHDLGHLCQSLVPISRSMIPRMRPMRPC